MSNYIFISAFSGKAKSSGQAFNKVSIFGNSANGQRVFDCFTENGVKLANQDQLKFGDIVVLQYKDSPYPGGRPSLCGLEVVEHSPYSLADMTLSK
jgi:hypothetical protein